jgi:hypothetical protein
MTYQLSHADATVTAISINPLTTTGTAYDLEFVGRGVPNFGLIHQSNFLKLLENFASPSAPGHPMPGQLWFDKSSGSQTLKFWTGSIWQAIARGTATNSQPPNPKVGDLWYDVVNNIIYTYNGTTWTISQSCACTVSATPPTFITKGQMWYNTTTSMLMVQIGENTLASPSKWVTAIDESLLYLALLM